MKSSRESTTRKSSAPKLLLDSGAFSVATGKCEEFPVEEYGEYVLQTGARAFNLDVIPLNGVSPEEASKGSLRNYRILSEMGCNPIPVYHLGEPLSVLGKILDLGPKLVALGGFARNRSDQVTHFMRTAFGYLCDSKGKPMVRVHGLGLSSLTSVVRFPFYSVDSSAFVLLGSRFASILLPLNGGFTKVAFTEFKTTPESYSSLSPAVQRMVREIVETRGFNFDAISTDWFARVEWNAVLQTERIEAHKPRPIHRKGFFHTPSETEGRLPRKTLLYLVPALDPKSHDMLERRKNLRVLVSYASIRKGSGVNFVDAFSRIKVPY